MIRVENKILEELQKSILEILVDIDKICRENDIEYSLFAGTLLGAVRHKGFIPWDDDIDIAMSRENYEKFLMICEAELDNKYFLQNYITEDEAHFLYSKIRLNDTLFVESIVENKDMHHGIFIDVFPLDRVKSYNYFQNHNVLRLKFYYHAYSAIMVESHQFENNKVKKTIRFILKRISNDKMIKRLRVKMMMLIKKYDKSQFKYYNLLTNGITKKRFHRFIIHEDDIKNLKRVNFEGYNLPVFANYDEILTRMYGDYMQVPDLEDRKTNHEVVELKL